MENQIKDNTGTPSVESLVERGYLFLEDSDWNKADEYFDKALDINPKHAPAYIGKLCAELNTRREESLGDYNELRKGKKIDRPLGEYGNFQKALRFADEGYLKKLNSYEQKLKESFPKIPKKFTDEFIKSEIARLEKEIANCDAEIAKGEKDYNNFQLRINILKDERQRIIDDYEGRYSFNDGYDYKYRWKKIENDESYQQKEKFINDATEMMNNAWRYVKENKDKKAEYEAKKRELESLAGISCLERMDVYYNRLAEAMQKVPTEDGYKNIAEQFRSLEGYKDSADLADKYGKMAIKLQYERLVQEKNKATTEEAYRELSKQFRKMGGYENSAQLADECDKLADECVKQKEREKKTLYDNLVQRKSTASTEGDYKYIAKEFREMGNYENAVQLANECDKQISVIIERREEQERQEKARIAAREAADAEARRKREAEAERKEKTKNFIGLLLQLGVTVAFLFRFFHNRTYITIFDNIPFEVIFFPCVISFVLGFISLIFRRNINSKIIWGAGFLIIAYLIIVIAIIRTIAEGQEILGSEGIIESLSVIAKTPIWSIIQVLIPAIFLIILFFAFGDSEGGLSIKDIIRIIIGFAVAGFILSLVFSLISGNGCMLIYVLFVIPVFPGMFMIINVEKS